MLRINFPKKLQNLCSRDTEFISSFGKNTTIKFPMLFIMALEYIRTVSTGIKIHFTEKKRDQLYAKEF